jgi:hypothetical protein
MPCKLTPCNLILTVDTVPGTNTVAAVDDAVVVCVVKSQDWYAPDWNKLNAWFNTADVWPQFELSFTNPLKSHFSVPAA